MPSHTFTRVGLWQESIDDQHRLGRRGAPADASTGEELHATDYQMYAYLQTAQDAAAQTAARRAARDRQRASIPTAVGGAAPPAGGVLRAGGHSRRAGRSSAAPGPKRRSSSCKPSRFPYADALTYSRGRSAPRAPATWRRARAGDRSLAGAARARRRNERAVLDGADRDPAPQRGGVAGLRRRTHRRRGRADAGRGRREGSRPRKRR